MPAVPGPLIAVLSSAIGGTAIGATRHLAALADPLTIGTLRYAGAFLLLAPIALWQGAKWPSGPDRRYAVGLGLLMFGLFPILFNASQIFTTAARAALALVTAPFLTMAVGGALGIERITLRKIVGVAIAVTGTATALGAGLSAAPPGAWRGDFLMAAGTMCITAYNIWSRPFIERSSSLGFSAFGMGVGGASLGVLAILFGDPSAVLAFDALAWRTAIYLVVFGGAITWFSYAIAIRRTSPTLVSVTFTVNPVTAAAYGALLLGEPIPPSLVIGFLFVLGGILIASLGGAAKDLGRN